MEHARIGIALGGGAARGWAHIGVLRALEAAGLRPDIIAGTSIGAVAGGCFAVSKLDELEAFARTLTPRQMFRYLDFNFTGTGIITGNRLGRQLHRHLEDTRIEELPRTFVAVATELGTGREIWLNKGPLVAAMRASYALPGVFKPVRINGSWLTDGALVNPVPVAVCRALGARLVIAVNLHSDCYTRSTLIPVEASADAVNGGEEPPAGNGRMSAFSLLRRQWSGKGDGAPGISRVMLEAFNITQDRIARSRLAGDPPDVTIAPRLGAMGLFDFHRADFAIARGREATLRQLEDIEHSANALLI